MHIMNHKQFCKVDSWMHENARPLDVAKWDHLFHGGSKQAIVDALCLYQNADGGMGHGLEADIQCPDSSAIATAEAIFQAYDYNLETDARWFRNLLAYLETTVRPIAKYWEDVPPAVMDHPHAPWWNYAPPTNTFSPNPCACIASALLRYGSEKQKALGEQVAKDCLNLLTGTGFCGDHDTLCQKVLVETLLTIRSPLVTPEVLASLKRRIRENTCLDPEQWSSYVFQPLDYVDSSTPPWYSALPAQAFEENIDYWLLTLQPEGFWKPNFDWGSNDAVARMVTKQWCGTITLKRARILHLFGRIEF